AAVGELLDGVFIAIGQAAALDDAAIDAEIAELVDDEAEAPAAGLLDQPADQAGLAGAEKAGDHGRGNLAGHLSALLEHERQAGADQHDLLARGGHHLVELTGGVAE